MADNRVQVTGSEKEMVRGAQRIGDIDPNEHIEVSLVLRPRTDASADDAARQATDALDARQYVDRANLGSVRGASPDDVAQVQAFASEYGLEASVDAARRIVRLSGTYEQLHKAFRPELGQYRLGDRTFRGRTGALSVPNRDLGDIVVAVLGFDDRPASKPHLRRLPDAATEKKHATLPGYTTRELASLYDFPSDLDGSGQCIALIELNDFDDQHNITGSGYSDTDLDAYFQGLHLTKPTVTAIPVDGGENKPGVDANADGEVTLDIEVAGAVAPKASIAVYFAPNTDKGFIDAISAAVHDTENKPSIISISWGGPEFSWTKQMRTAFNDALNDAMLAGVTVCVAAGDNGSSDEPATDQQGNPIRDGHAHVDFPSADPLVLACGGTKLPASALASEVVWNEGDAGGAGGGGVSEYYKLPTWQKNANVPKSPGKHVGRGVPDVAADADPNTGYKIYVGGQPNTFGGTSAVAPLMAGLLALANQRRAANGKQAVGFVNEILYNAPANTAFRDITGGDNDIDGGLNGLYKAGPGWDACTGLGVPVGSQVLALLT